MEYIRYSDSLEALVMGGGAGADQGTGDCVLLDFRNCFFAVADSSARSLPLSRKLLVECAALMDAMAVHDRIFRPDGHEELVAAVRAGLEGILEKHYGRGSCALTGVILLKGDPETELVLLHTGDTGLYLYDGESGSAKQLTRSNFWMAGKSRNLYQAEIRAIPGGSWLLLATDGMMDAIRATCGDLEKFFESRVGGSRGDAFVRDLVSRSAGGSLYDDVGMILFRPGMIEPHGKRIMLGGVGGELPGDVDPSRIR